MMKTKKIKEMIDEATARELADLFSSLSDGSRVRIIAALVGGELHVGAIAEEVGLSESATSHQLRVLRQMRIVAARKSGRQVYYRLADDHILDLYQRGLEHISHP